MRRELVAAAAALFTRKGYEDTTVDDIAAAGFGIGWGRHGTLRGCGGGALRGNDGLREGSAG